MGLRCTASNPRFTKGSGNIQEADSSCLFVVVVVVVVVIVVIVVVLQIRFYPRTCNLDNAFAQHVKLPSPSFLVNVFRNLLLAYCSDCRVVFYSLEKIPGNLGKFIITRQALRAFVLFAPIANDSYEA